MDLINGSQLLASLVVNVLIDSICYPPYGCFTNEAPFDNPLYPLPLSPESLNTQFWLHRRDLKKRLQIDPHDNHFGSNIKDQKTVIIGHGFLEDITAWWIQPMVDSLLKANDMNVIVVNWRDAARPTYNQAVGNSRLVGRQVSYLVGGIVNKTNIKPSQIHLIGFSLGAHMMGYAGQWSREKGQLIGRITGLDAAGVYFEGTNEKVRLDPTDADFVDAIHTDSKTILVAGLGASEPLGHVDFYPNGGYHQPGCKKISFSRKAYVRGARKNKCMNMGYHAEKTANEKYYLLTDSKEPFTGYHYSIKVVTGGRNFADSYAQLKFQIIGQEGKSDILNAGSGFLDQVSPSTFVLFAKENVGEIQRIQINTFCGLVSRCMVFGESYCTAYVGKRAVYQLYKGLVE